MWTPSGTRQKAWSRRAEKRERARDGDFPASTPLKRAEFLKGHGSEIDGEAKLRHQGEHREKIGFRLIIDNSPTPSVARREWAAP